MQTQVVSPLALAILIPLNLSFTLSESVYEFNVYVKCMNLNFIHLSTLARLLDCLAVGVDS